ncbi:MAG: C-GCAxxG-C-C family protein [Eubacteriales bacterium]|nr:C-GCAxxG-C-C family protein [Eubacteriales bacterium]
MTKREKSQSLFLNGYNCAQSVFAAFCDETGFDENTALKISSGFGGGMGRLREVCGAVSGMFMVVSMLYGYDEAGDDLVKMELYKKVQDIANRFRIENQTIICRELLQLEEENSDPTPGERTPEYYGHHACCVKAVGDAAEILEQFINENK